MSEKTIIKYIKDVYSDSVDFWNDSFLINLLRPSEAFSRKAYEVLILYEKMFIGRLNTLLVHEFNLTIKQIDNKDFPEKITALRRKELISLLMEFTSTFENLKRKMSITTVKGFKKFKQILDMYMDPLIDSDIRNEDLLEFFSEAPYYIEDDMIRSGILPGKELTISVKTFSKGNTFLEERKFYERNGESQNQVYLTKEI